MRGKPIPVHSAFCFSVSASAFCLHPSAFPTQSQPSRVQKRVVDLHQPREPIKRDQQRFAPDGEPDGQTMKTDAGRLVAEDRTGPQARVGR